MRGKRGLSNPGRSALLRGEGMPAVLPLAVDGSCEEEVPVASGGYGGASGWAAPVAVMLIAALTCVLTGAGVPPDKPECAPANPDPGAFLQQPWPYLGRRGRAFPRLCTPADGSLPHDGTGPASHHPTHPSVVVRSSWHRPACGDPGSRDVWVLVDVRDLRSGRVMAAK